MGTLRLNTIPEWRTQSLRSPVFGHGGGLILCLALLVTGCLGQQTPVYPPPVTPVPDLHLPGVVKVPGIVSLETRTHTPWISNPIAYIPAGAASPHVLFQLGYGLLDTLYDVELDGSGLRRISLGTQCLPGLAVTPDGRAVICRTEHGLWGKSLQGSTSPASSGQALLTTPADTTLYNLAWTPDGQYLSAYASTAGRCRIALYGPSAQATVEAPKEDGALLLAGLLDLSALGSDIAPSCPFAYVSWSPDGHWLAVTAVNWTADLHQDTVFLLPAAPIRRALAQVGTSIPTLRVSLDGSQKLVIGQTAQSPAWSADAALLATTNYINDELEQTTVATGITTPLISPPAGRFCQSISGGYSWVPNGRQFVFVLCTPTITDQAQPPATMYVYTPPG